MSHRLDLLNSTAGILAATTLTAASIAAPTPARADLGETIVKGVIAGIVICGVSGACTKRSEAATPTQNGKRARSAGAQDVALTTREQRKDIQIVLADQGLYRSGIDGSFGPGTRNAIRAWQEARGYAATGILNGSQINELLMAAPRYADLDVTDPERLEIAVADELDRESLFKLQTELNAMGYDAGSPDGVMGRRTRSAIAAYMADRGLEGKPVATRLLLAHVSGDFEDEAFDYAGVGAAEIEDGPRAVGDDSVIYQGVAGADAGLVPVDETPEEFPTEVASLETFQFDILSLQTGMSRDEVELTLADYLPADAIVDFGRAEEFGGAGALTLGHRMLSPTWPEVSAEEIVTFYDESDMVAGAIAVVRTVVLPVEVASADYVRETVPALKEAYGTEALVGEDASGTLTWVGDAFAREAILKGDITLADCGAVSVSPSADAMLWNEGGGPRLGGTMREAATACGEVLSVRFADGDLQFALWNSDAMTDLAASPRIDAEPMDGDAGERVVPKIEF